MQPEIHYFASKVKFPNPRDSSVIGIFKTESCFICAEETTGIAMPTKDNVLLKEKSILPF